MPKIQIKPNERFADIIEASSLFIDSVGQSKDIYVHIFYADGQKERQEIVSGSKFSEGRDGEKISKVVFHNPTGTVANITYHYSLVYGYDEARVIGDINALTRFDNLTSDNNQFFTGLNFAAPGAGNFINFGVINPTGSGKYVYVSKTRVSGFGANVEMRTGAENLLEQIGSFKNKDISKSDSASKRGWDGGSSLTRLGSFLSGLPTSTSGNPTSLDFKNAPIKIPEGQALIFVPTVTNSKLSAYVEIYEEDN